MKTFDIFVDKRLIKSDLIIIGKDTIRCDIFVTDMLIRDDIAAFCGIVFGSNVDSIISEKAFYCDDESCSVVVNAFVNSAAIKNIFIDESHIDINAEAKLTNGFTLVPDNIYVTIEQSIRETVKKLISARSITELGVTESLFILPMKSLGKYENITCVNTSIRFAKTSYLTQHDEIELCLHFKEHIEKYISADNECGISCSADISMCRFRTLEDADGLGMLENIDSMVLDDLYYINID